MPRHKKTVSRRVKKNKTQKRRGGGLWELLFGPKEPAPVPVQAATTTEAAPAPAAAPTSEIKNPLVDANEYANQDPNKTTQSAGVATMGGKRSKKSKSSKKSSKK